jgi:type I restriction enzyme S subunit
MLGSSARLGDLTKIRTGKLDANASSEDGEYPFFTCARDPLRISSYSYDCECVLVAGNGDLNVKYYEGKFDAYQRTYIVEALKESKHDLHLRYVYHFLETYLETLREQSIGGIIKYIKIGNLTDAIIPLPPLDEQKRIAAILDAADELRAKRRASLALLDDLLQSTFLDMFGDPVTNPMGWESQLLGELTDVGSSKRVFVSDLVKSGVPFYRGTEIGQMGEGTSIQPSLFITQEKYEELKAQSGVPSVGDLLLPSICHDGRIYVVENDSPFYFKDGRVLWIKNDAGAVNSTFLRYHLRQVFRSNYSRIASGTTFAELKIFALKGVQIQTPPLDLQQRFAAIVEAIEQQKARYRAHLDELDTLFASLQSRAFNGEL